jgi:hypothetical protein
MRFFRKRMKPSWAFPERKDVGDKKVWRLLPGREVLVAEFRNPDKKTTEIVGLDLSSGSLLWKNERGEEGWWIIPNTIYRDTVLLQEFSKPDMPTPSKVFCIDLYTGDLLWENHEVSYINANGDTIYCSKESITSEKIVGLNFRTGVEREILMSELPGGDYSYQSEFDSPQPVDDLHERIDIEGIPKSLFPVDPKHLSTLKIGNKNVFGFYAISGKDAKGGTLYDARLVVVNREKEVLFEAIVDEKVHVPLPDFYFAAGETLIYVRNSSVIVALKLA